MITENAIIKDWRKIDFSFGLVYPNKYKLAMSSYSIRLLYYMINSYDNFVCERLFLPEKIKFPASKDYSSENQLRSMENKVLPIEFDILGFSIQFENDFRNILWILEKAGIPIPEYSLNPEEILPPFKNYIIKNLIDQQNYAFNPKIEKKDGYLNVKDERALNEKGKYNYLFYQKFIRSKWEYKIYRIGEDYFYYKQLPILVEPDKMKTRREIDPNPELKKLVKKATNTIDLKIASVDFLKSKEGIYYLTDINSTPNFNYIPAGPKLVGDYIKAQATR